MDTKIVFFYYRKQTWYRRLVNFMTGCGFHHVGILRQDSQLYYEMGATWHSHPWERRVDAAAREGVDVFIINAPCEVSHDLLLRELSDQPMDPDGTYGVLDYIGFAARKIGLKINNLPGVICSEKVWNLCVEAGWAAPSLKGYSPSPCDLFRAIMNHYSPSEV